MKTLKEVREDYIRMVLERCGGDAREASSVLQISEKRLKIAAKRLARPAEKERGARNRDGR